jgi:hypothetical protein
MKLPRFLTTVFEIFVIILFAALPFLGFYFGQKYYQTNNIISNQPSIVVPASIPPTNSWSKPISNSKTIPIIKDGILYAYSLVSKQLEPTIYHTRWGSGSSGLGEDNPLPSPDGQYIAFINTDDKSCLYILPSGSLIAKKITDYPIHYINSWSSDSSKILFYTQADNLETRKEGGMGETPVWETIETFIKGSIPGFHTFNLNNGADIYLYPLSTAYEFIDSNRILVEQSQYDGDGGKKRLVLFNADDFTADYATVNSPDMSTNSQESFSADGDYWARTVDQGFSGSGVKIIFSKFPSTDGDVVASGAWAFVEKPLLNSNAKYLAYTKRGGQIKEGQFAGQYKNKTIIWDVTSKTNMVELDGWPQYWVDENTLLIGQSEYGNNPSNFTGFNLFHVDTRQTDPIPIK